MIKRCHIKTPGRLFRRGNVLSGADSVILFEAADKALYRAKNMGKNRIVIWSDAYEKI